MGSASTTSSQDLPRLRDEVFRSARLVLVPVAVMWVLEAVDQLLLRGALDHLGIRPRSMSGLWGIPVAPWLHGGFGHLMANTAPLLVLGTIIVLRSRRDLVVVSVLATLVGGAGIWLLGAPRSNHIGASILVFGYLGFLLWRGWYERRLGSMFVSMAVAVAYGGALWGVLPVQQGISWEGHLFGLLGGVMAARLLARRSPPPSARPRRT